MLLTRVFFLIWTVSFLAADSSHARKADSADTVAHLIAAFNAHDPQAMGSVVSEDFELYYISGAEVSLGAKGREALIREMKGYFESTPGVRSELESAVPAGDFIAFRERVFWQQEGSERSQFSLTVYEVRDGLVHRAWYYPAVR